MIGGAARLLGGALFALAVFCALDVRASWALDPATAAKIDETAAAIGALSTQPPPPGASGADALFQAETTMNRVVIGAIVRDPGAHAEIVGHAVRAAPALGAAIVQKSSQRFPGFADAIAAAAAGVAPEPDEAGEERAMARLPEPVSDPFETVNRGIFFVNDLLDTVIIRPVAWAYGWVTPDVIKDGVRRGFDNFNSPIVFANDLLQLEFEDAAVTAGRTVINSTVGLAGFFDVAESWGLPKHDADFGQTLHSYGVGPGPYIVIPVIGPSTLRDGTGSLADIFLHPRTYLLDVNTNLYISLGDGVTERETFIEPLDDLKATSLDYYAALRSAYYQSRAVELNRGQPLEAAAIDDLFDDFE